MYPQEFTLGNLYLQIIFSVETRCIDTLNLYKPWEVKHCPVIYEEQKKPK